MISHVSRLILAWIFAISPGLAQQQSQIVPEPVVVILQGVDALETFLISESWWGELNSEDQLLAPRLLLTGIPAGWQESSRSLPVQVKKELFYRLTLPLILHANEMIRERRLRLQDLSARSIPELDSRRTKLSG